jgi:hypothetical protein
MFRALARIPFAFIREPLAAQTICNSRRFLSASAVRFARNAKADSAEVKQAAEPTPKAAESSEESAAVPLNEGTGPYRVISVDRSGLLGMRHLASDHPPEGAAAVTKSASTPLVAELKKLIKVREKEKRAWGWTRGTVSEFSILVFVVV